ncbi:M15 family metallopeptidase [Rhizobium sp. TH2]|uniref:M15 family metallopeptidase n=1 Tax=Rhizobium sp. TH2 TaxID=2775403 RepID=UPI0021571005|nr:M15 family metallopeptidase [Rhizobium sp. TH2]
MKQVLLAVGVVLSLASSTAVHAKDLTLSEKIDILVKAYPDTLNMGSEKGVGFIRHAQLLPVDDGVKRDHFQMLEEGDIEDSLQQIYPAGACETRPDVNFDPGRIRSEKLMTLMYGDSKKEVARNLVPVKWFGETLQVTSVNSVNMALEAVHDELASRPDLKKYLTPSAGGFNFRKVAGQKNLSVHSFGAAIDLNTKFADYWVWSKGKPGNVPVYKNKFPMEIVAIFEKHGFIWGGRWYHYDTMHFEYRPELLEIAKRAGVSACK